MTFSKHAARDKSNKCLVLIYFFSVVSIILHSRILTICHKFTVISALIKSLKDFHLKFNHPQPMSLYISYVGYLCLTLTWAVLQPGLNWRVVPVHQLSTTNYCGTHQSTTLETKEVISREKFPFLVHVGETSASFGKVQVPPYWNVSQSREPCALGKLARSVCKIFWELKMNWGKLRYLLHPWYNNICSLSESSRKSPYGVKKVEKPNF